MAAGCAYTVVEGFTGFNVFMTAIAGFICGVAAVGLLIFYYQTKIQKAAQAHQEKMMKDMIGGLGNVAGNMAGLGKKKGLQKVQKGVQEMSKQMMPGAASL